MSLSDGLADTGIAQPLAVDVTQHNQIGLTLVDALAEGRIVAAIGIIDLIGIRVVAGQPAADRLVMWKVVAVATAGHLCRNDAQTIPGIPFGRQPVDQPLQQAIAFGGGIHREQVGAHGRPSVTLLLRCHDETTYRWVTAAINIGGQNRDCRFRPVAGEGDGVVTGVPADGVDAGIQAGQQRLAPLLGTGQAGARMVDQLIGGCLCVVFVADGLCGMADEAEADGAVTAHRRYGVDVALEVAVTTTDALQHMATAGLHPELATLAGF